MTKARLIRTALSQIFRTEIYAKIVRLKRNIQIVVRCKQVASPLIEIDSNKFD